MDDLPLDLSVLRRLIGLVADQFPVLREIAVKGIGVACRP
jgi:hypothetical protein